MHVGSRWITLFALAISLSGLAASPSLESRLNELASQVESLKAEVKRLSSRSRDEREKELKNKQLLYAIDDQHDTLVASLESTMTGIAQGKIRLQLDRDILRRIRELFEQGATPAVNLITAQNNVRTDEYALAASYQTLRSQQAKVASLEALHQGKLLEFAVKDRDSNAAQVASCESSLQIARIGGQYDATLDRALTHLTAQGLQPVAVAISQRVNAAWSAESVSAWERVCARYLKQLEASQAELTRLKKLFGVSSR